MKIIELKYINGITSATWTQGGKKYSKPIWGKYSEAQILKLLSDNPS